MRKRVENYRVFLVLLLIAVVLSFVAKNVQEEAGVGVLFDPGTGTVTVTLTDGSVNEQEFRVYRTDVTVGTARQLIATITSTSVSGTGNTYTYQHNANILDQGHDYLYQATAWNSFGESEYTSAPALNIPIGTPDDPTNIDGIATYNQIDLTWTDVSVVEDRYEIDRAVGIGSFVNIENNLLQNSESYTDNNVQPDTTYSYRVRACSDPITGSGLCSGNLELSNVLTLSAPIPTPAITGLSVGSNSGSGGTGSGVSGDPLIVDMTNFVELIIAGSDFDSNAEVSIGSILSGQSNGVYDTVWVSSSQIIVNIKPGSLPACPGDCIVGLHRIVVENVPNSPGGNTGSDAYFLKAEVPAPTINSLQLNGVSTGLSSVSFETSQQMTIILTGDDYYAVEPSTSLFAGSYIKFRVQGSTGAFTVIDQSSGLIYTANGDLEFTLSANSLSVNDYEFYVVNPNQVPNINIGSDPVSAPIIFSVTQPASCVGNEPTVSGITAVSSGTDIIVNRGTDSFTVAGTGFDAGSSVIIGPVTFGVNSVPPLIFDPLVPGELQLDNMDVEGIFVEVHDVSVVDSNGCSSLNSESVTLTVTEETPNIAFDYTSISQGGTATVTAPEGEGFYGNNNYGTYSEFGLVTTNPVTGTITSFAELVGLYGFVSSTEMSLSVAQYPLGSYEVAVENPGGSYSNVKTIEIVAVGCGNGYPDAGEECGESGLSCSSGYSCSGCSCNPDSPGGNGGGGGGGGGGSSSARDCNNNRDDDGDQYCDYDGATAGVNGCSGLPDPGCSSANDNDEFNTVYLNTARQCADGLDNDNDGEIDWPEDDGCENIFDDDEFDTQTGTAGTTGTTGTTGIGEEATRKFAMYGVIGLLIVGILITAVLILRNLRKKQGFNKLVRNSNANKVVKNRRFAGW